MRMAAMMSNVKPKPDAVSALLSALSPRWSRVPAPEARGYAPVEPVMGALNIDPHPPTQNSPKGIST